MSFGTITDWLRLARVSNLPTTWTNVLVGAAIVAPRPDVDGLVVAGAVTGLLYVGGMILNDVVDADRDAARGISRPIPAGRVSRRVAGAVAIACLVAGVAVAAGAAGAVAGGWALALAACVVGYDLLKEQGAVALGLMGACRGLIIPLAAALQDVGPIPAGPVLLVAGSLAAYVTLVTVAARGEHEAASRGPGETSFAASKWLLVAPVCIAGAGLIFMGAAEGDPAFAWSLGAGGIVIAVVAAVWTGWTVRKLQDDGRVPAAVMRWLAGICLFDAALLAILGTPPAVVAGACAAFLLTRRAQRRIAGS